MRILRSLAIIGMVAALTIGATGAYFSDQKSITGNTFATGTLKLTLNKSAGKPFSVTAAYPGYWTNWEYMDIFNGPYPAVAGQLPFEAYMTVSKTGGDSVLWDNLQVTMKTSGRDSDCTNGDGGEKTVYNGNIKDFPVHNLVSSANYWHLANESDASGSPADNIRPGYSERICQKTGLLNTAGNDIQGKSVTFSEIVDAEQDND